MGGGEVSVTPPGHVTRKLAHLMELSAKTVHSVSFTQITGGILEPPAYLEKTLDTWHTLSKILI